MAVLILGIVLIAVLAGRKNDSSTNAPGSTPVKEPRFVDKRTCAALTEMLGQPVAQLGASDDVKKHSQWYQGDELYPSERMSLVHGSNTVRQVQCCYSTVNSFQTNIILFCHYFAGD
jgi:hypothetical protein